MDCIFGRNILENIITKGYISEAVDKQVNNKTWWLLITIRWWYFYNGLWNTHKNMLNIEYYNYLIYLQSYYYYRHGFHWYDIQRYFFGFHPFYFEIMINMCLNCSWGLCREQCREIIRFSHYFIFISFVSVFVLCLNIYEKINMYEENENVYLLL